MDGGNETAQGFLQIKKSSWATKKVGMVRPCVIYSIFQVPWPPEIGARALPTQHKDDFQHSTLLTYCRCLFKVCVENFQNLERSMSYALCTM
jgi:hypothetical protein